MSNSAIDKLWRALERAKARMSLPPREDEPLMVFSVVPGQPSMLPMPFSPPADAKFGPRLFHEQSRVALQGQPQDVDAVRTLDWMIGRLTRKFNGVAVPQATIDKIAAHIGDLQDPLSRIHARTVDEDATAVPQKQLVYTHAFTQKDGVRIAQPLLSIPLARS